MFKKFNPKDDVSGSTSLKSSVQRGIRSQLIEQLPFLNLPAYRERSAISAPSNTSEAAAPALTDDVAVAEEGGAEVDGADEDVGKGKKKKSGSGKDKESKSGKKGGKGGKKDKEKEKEKDDDDDGQGGSEVVVPTVLDEIWPKKEPLGLTKCHDRINIYTLHTVPLFFNHFDGPFIPTLKLLHKYPSMLPHVQVDRGAIKFLLAGANMMAPGLLSPGGRLPAGLAKDAIVAIHAEGKEHAAGIGKMAASSEDVRASGKGVAVEVLCWVGDDFWKINSIGV